MALEAGSRLGPYDVLSPIGAGGMGEVYRARDPRLGRDVALKVLPAEHTADPDRLRRFEREARAVAALNHPHILAVFDVGREGGVSYVVFELLEGHTLRRRLERGPLSTRKAVEYAVQVCRGLSAAHARDIVHRDLTPSNLFLTRDGQVKILDFGLAKLVAPVSGEGVPKEASTRTAPGLVPGTVGYLSPEQVRGQEADARSDLFAVGAILYEMLSGRQAFVGETAVDTLSAILHQEPPEIVGGEGPIPLGLERVVRRCLEKDPEERFQSARDMAFAIEALSGSPGTGIVAPGAEPRRARGARTLVAVAAAVGLVGLGGLAGRTLWQRPLPAVTQLTYENERIEGARFAPDGRTAAENVVGADWPPDGGEPAVIPQDCRHRPARLEYPICAVLVAELARTDLVFLVPRASPRDGRVAVTLGGGELLLMGRPGRRQRLAAPPSPHGLAWDANGEAREAPERDVATTGGHEGRTTFPRRGPGS
jgi:hypothetical protein